MTVLAGDVIGFCTPGGSEGLRLVWAPVPDNTLLQGLRSALSVSRSSVATFTDSPTTLGSSPCVFRHVW